MSGSDMSYPCVRTRIVNDSDFPTSFVRAAFDFYLPAGVKKIDVVFLEPVATGTGESSGQCWLNGVERNNFQRPFIYVAVSKADRFPSPPQRTAWKEGYLPEPCFASREEMAIYILAHELRHVWQWRLLGGISERDACAYGIHILRRWRRGGPPTYSRRTFGAGNFPWSESDDRGKVANMPAPRPPIGAAAREKILAHWPNSIRSEPRGGSPCDSVAKSGCYIASDGERSTPSWPSTPKSKS